MDISVSQLNGRLAAKLPPELPLGLVFVVGEVSQVEGKCFVLTESVHHLQCQLVDPFNLSAGDVVRASGHLMFDPNRLQYYLLTRDIEIEIAEPLGRVDDSSRKMLAEGKDLLSALAAVKTRAALAPKESNAELPVWVRKLAPPEVQAADPDDDAAIEDEHSLTAADRSVVLDEALVSMLSAAMDSEEELELTPEILEPYAVAKPKSTAQNHATRTEDTAVPANPSSYQPTNRADTDWLIILLIISFFVLTVAAIVTTVLLILQ